MTYKEALNIGSVAAGAVKCTYTMLYDAQGNKLFSFQRVHGQYVFEPDEALTERVGQTVLVRRPDLSEADTSAYFYSREREAGVIVFPDIPLVRATEYVPDKRLVPVYLTDAARQWIEICCPKGYVYEIYNLEGNRERTLTEDKKDLLDGYVRGGYTYKQVYRFDKINAYLMTGNAMYVKPDSLYWTIEKLPENNELAELKAKYEKARAILLASLPTALIP